MPTFGFHRSLVSRSLVMLRHLAVAFVLFAASPVTAGADWEVTGATVRAAVTAPVPLGQSIVWAAETGSGAVDVWVASPGRAHRRVTRLAPTQPERRITVGDLASSPDRVAVAVREVGKSSRVPPTEEDVFSDRVLTFGADLRVSEVAGCVPEGRGAPAFVPTLVRVADRAVVFQIPECVRDGLGGAQVRDYGSSPPSAPEIIAGPEEILRDASGPFAVLGPGGGGARAVDLRSKTTVNDVAARDDAGALRVTPTGVILAQRRRPTAGGLRYELLERRPGMEPRPLGPVLRSPTAVLASDQAVVFGTDVGGLDSIGQSGAVRAIARYSVGTGSGSLQGARLVWTEPTFYAQRFVVTDLGGVSEPRDRTGCPLRLAAPPRLRRTVVDLSPVCTSYVEECEGTARLTEASTGRRLGSGSSSRIRLTGRGRRVFERRRDVRVRLEVRMQDVRGRVETRAGRMVLRGHPSRRRTDGFRVRG